MIREYFNMTEDIELIQYINEKFDTDNIVPLTYDIIFEVNMNDDVLENNSISFKVVNKLNKMISSIIRFISSIIKSIYNFINSVFTSNKVKKAFEEFKKECESDPSLRNKKITITDYKKINKEYDKKLKEITEKQYELRKDEEAEIDTFVKDFIDEVNKVSKSVTTIVTVDTAEKMAIANHEIAKDIAKKLESDETILKNIEKEIGSKNAKKFERNIKRASNDSILIKLKSIIYAKKYKTLTDVTSEIVDNVNNIITKDIGISDVTNLSKISKYAKQNDTLKPYISTVKSGYKKGKQMEKKYKEE